MLHVPSWYDHNGTCFARCHLAQQDGNHLSIVFADQDGTAYNANLVCKKCHLVQQMVYTFLHPSFLYFHFKFSRNCAIVFRHPCFVSRFHFDFLLHTKFSILVNPALLTSNKCQGRQKSRIYQSSPLLKTWNENQPSNRKLEAKSQATSSVPNGRNSKMKTWPQTKKTWM